MHQEASILQSWHYVSIHITHLTDSLNILDKILKDWKMPPWAIPARNLIKDESFIAIFLTRDEKSRCSLHKDAVDSAWLVTAGDRILWTLPPSCEHHLDLQYSQKDSSFEIWSKGDAELTSLGWRKAELRPGDWVCMPKGWWHVTEATPGSVMVNVRIVLPEVTT